MAIISIDDLENQSAPVKSSVIPIDQMEQQSGEQQPKMTLAEAEHKRKLAEVDAWGPNPYLNSIGDSINKTVGQVFKAPVSVPSQALTDMGQGTPIPQRLKNTADVLTGNKESDYGTMLKAGGVPDNIANPTGAVADFVAYPGVGVKGVVDMAKGTGELVKAGGKAITELGAKNLDNRIFGLYNDAVGAKIKNAGTDINNFKNNRIDAMKTISDNLPEIKLPDHNTGEMVSRAPENRYELLQSLNQAKKQVWKKVSQMSGGATEAGAAIDMNPLVTKALNETISSLGEDYLKANPSVVEDLVKEAAKIKSIGVTNPSRLEQFMAAINKTELPRLRQSGQAVDYSIKDLYNNLMPKLSEASDNIIEQTLEKSGYKEYRKQYSSLKSAEKEVLGSANKYLRSEAGQGGGVSHPLINLWSLEEVLQGGGKILTGNPVGGMKDLGKATLIKGASKIIDHFRSPDRKITKMFELLDKRGANIGKVNESVVNGGAVDAELVQPDKPRITGLPDKSIQMGPTTRAGVDRPWENQGLPSPRTAGQSSGSVIKQGTSYKEPENPVVTSEPKYRTENAYALKYQLQKKNSVPLHPSEEGRAALKEIYPPAEKGNPNIPKDKLDSFNEMMDWQLSQESGGVKIHGGKQTGSERTKSVSANSNTPLFQKISGNSQPKGFDLLKKAANGEKMTPGEKLKIKMLIHEFETKIKPKM